MGAIIKTGSVVRGPAYIGKNTVIGPKTYVGPYTSIGGNSRLVNIEIENSIVMDDVEIVSEGERIVDSIIGARARIVKHYMRPHGLRFIIGENTTIII